MNGIQVLNIGMAFKFRGIKHFRHWPSF